MRSCVAAAMSSLGAGLAALADLEVLAERARVEHPLVDLHPHVPERVVGAAVDAGHEPVERDAI
jgi:hypothetical protein